MEMSEKQLRDVEMTKKREQRGKKVREGRGLMKKREGNGKGGRGQTDREVEEGNRGEEGSIMQ